MSCSISLGIERQGYAAWSVAQPCLKRLLQSSTFHHPPHPTRHWSTYAKQSIPSATQRRAYCGTGGQSRANQHEEGWGRDWTGRVEGWFWRTSEKGKSARACKGLHRDQRGNIGKLSLVQTYLSPACPSYGPAAVHPQFERGNSNYSTSRQPRAYPRLPPPSHILPPPSPLRKLTCPSPSASTAVLQRPPSLPHHRESNILLILPITFLKSSAALKLIATITRVALTLLPFSLRAKLILVLQKRYLADIENAPSWLLREAERATKHAGKLHFNAKFILPFLVSLPFILLGASIVTSYETTPISGRRRLIIISPEEESTFVNSVLGAGFQLGNDRRDWISILREMLSLEDEGVSSRTGRRLFLGGEVLDERDWRFRWSDDILRVLEAGVAKLALNKGEAANPGFPRPPPCSWPLEARGASLESGGDLVAEYELVLIERPESNAFSFGFGPEVGSKHDVRGKRGVIVLYTGFIDEILGTSSSSTGRPSPPPSNFTGIFRRVFGLPQVRKETPNHLPTVAPTANQSKSLAVVLSHELSHLILSHTVESAANSSLLVTHLSKLMADTLRTLVYFATAPFGPFVNDAVGRSIEVGTRDSVKTLRLISNSCESRIMEMEADVVSLRILANAGVDPRHAVQFWEHRLDTAASPSTSHVHPQRDSIGGPPAFVEEGTKLCGFLRTHPVNEDRLECIRAELERWNRAAVTLS